MPLTTFNPSDHQADFGLTNGNLTATLSAGHISGNAIARCTNSVAVGTGGFKVYCEAVWSTIGAGNVQVGLSIGTQSLTDFLGSAAANGLGWSNGGGVFGPGITIDPYVVGNTCCMALDMANKLFWGKVNAANWNGSTTAHPETGVGGLSFSSVTVNIFAAAQGVTANDSVTFNMGAKNFAQAVPIGFTPWNQFFDAAVLSQRSRNSGPIRW